MCTFCYLSPISAMPLQQTNCNNFFFHPISVMPLPQIHSHKFFFFPSISAMVLPKTNWNKFFSLLFQQCHCHNSIPLFFVIEERDKLNCFSKKKYWKNKIMRTFFNISPLFRQCHCHKQQIFFFHPIQIHSHIFFPSILAMALPQTMYFFLFLFLFTAL